MFAVKFWCFWKFAEVFIALENNGAIASDIETLSDVWKSYDSESDIFMLQLHVSPIDVFDGARFWEFIPCETPFLYHSNTGVRVSLSASSAEYEQFNDCVLLGVEGDMFMLFIDGCEFNIVIDALLNSVSLSILSNAFTEQVHVSDFDVAVFGIVEMFVRVFTGISVEPEEYSMLLLYQV